MAELKIEIPGYDPEDDSDFPDQDMVLVLAQGTTDRSQLTLAILDPDGHILGELFLNLDGIRTLRSSLAVFGRELRRAVSESTEETSPE